MKKKIQVLKSAGGACPEDNDAEKQVTFNDASGDTMADTALHEFLLECYNKHLKARINVQDVDGPAAACADVATATTDDTDVSRFVPATDVPASFMEHGYYCFKCFVVKAEKHNFTNYVKAERNFSLRYIFPEAVKTVSRADAKREARMDNAAQRSNAADIQAEKDRLNNDMKNALAKFRIMQSSFSDELDKVMRCFDNAEKYGVGENENKKLKQKRVTLMEKMDILSEDHEVQQQRIAAAIADLEVPPLHKRIKMEPSATPIDTKVEKAFMPVLNAPPSACNGTDAGSASADST